MLKRAANRVFPNHCAGSGRVSAGSNHARGRHFGRLWSAQKRKPENASLRTRCFGRRTPGRASRRTGLSRSRLFLKRNHVEQTLPRERNHGRTGLANPHQCVAHAIQRFQRSVQGPMPGLGREGVFDLEKQGGRSVPIAAPMGWPSLTPMPTVMNFFRCSRSKAKTAFGSVPARNCRSNSKSAAAPSPAVIAYKSRSKLSAAASVAQASTSSSVTSPTAHRARVFPARPASAPGHRPID